MRGEFTQITVNLKADGGRALHSRVAHPGRMVADGMAESEILSACPDPERADLSEALDYDAEACANLFDAGITPPSP